jgi:molybdopterin-guanine dinucleotide biosynthesis protein A
LNRTWQMPRLPSRIKQRCPHAKQRTELSSSFSYNSPSTVRPSITFASELILPQTSEVLKTSEVSVTYYNMPMLTIVIQAGGQSSRMGEDKALKPFLGKPLIQRVVDRLAPIADELIVTTNRPGDYTFLNTSTLPSGSPFVPRSAAARWPSRPGRPGLPARTGCETAVQRLRLVSDLKPGRGPLGGLYTALVSATCPLVAVVACDMPFASAKLIESAGRLLVEEGADVVIAKTDAGYEPFHAVYRRESCLPAIESSIEADQWKMIAWFPHVKVRTLSSEEVKSLDPSGLCFWNLNTPEEFSEAERRANEQ